MAGLPEIFPNFLPAAVEHLQSRDAIALAKSIQRQLVWIPLSWRAIATAYVRQGSIGTPILLLHGSDSSVLEFRCLLWQ